MVEWLRLDNADGIDGLRRDVVTAGVALTRRPFTLAYAYEWQRDRERGESAGRATQHTASISYDLSQATPLLRGFEWTIGWRRLSEDGEAANDFGTQLTYGYRF